MHSSGTINHEPLAQSVVVRDNLLTVHLVDGRRVAVPLDWYPRLEAGNPDEQACYELTGKGSGIHWPRLDEDISVEALLAGRRSVESRASLNRWRDERAKP